MAQEQISPLLERQQSILSLSVENLQLYKSIKDGRRSPKKYEESVQSPLNKQISEKSISKSSQVKESIKSGEDNILEQHDQIGSLIDKNSEKSDKSLQRVNSNQSFQTDASPHSPICLETREIEGPSRTSRAKKPDKFGLGNTYTNEDLKKMGTKILEDVSRNPQKYRMGDILHQVQRKVTKDFEPMERQFKRQEERRKASVLQFKDAMRKQLDSAQSGASFKDKDGEMFAFAEELKTKIAKDRDYAIDCKLLYDEHLKFYQQKLGIEERQRMDDKVLPPSQMDNLVKLTMKFYKKQKRVQKGNRECRELQAIHKGQLKDHPEFKEKKRRQREQALSFAQSKDKFARSEVQPELPSSLMSPRESPHNHTIEVNGTPPRGFETSELSQTNITDFHLRNTPNQQSNVTFVPAIVQNDSSSGIQEAIKTQFNRNPSVPVLEIDQSKFGLPQINISSIASEDGGYIDGAMTEKSQSGQGHLPKIKIKQPGQMSYLKSPKKSLAFSSIGTTPKIKVQTSAEYDMESKCESVLDDNSRPCFQRKYYIDHVEKMRRLTDSSKKSLSPRLSKQELSIRKQTRKTSVALENIKNQYLQEQQTMGSDPFSQRSFSVPRSRTQAAQHSQSQISGQSQMPNFIDSVFVKDTRNIKALITSARQGLDSQSIEENTENPVIHLPNKTQFQTIKKLLEEYYCVDEPHLAGHEQYQELKQRLKKKNFLNINVVENENLKIMREQNGQGARLETNLKARDDKMKQFNKHLNKILVRVDPFMQNKFKAQIRNEQRKRERIKNKRASSKAASQARYEEPEKNGAFHQIERQMADLTVKLKEVIQQSPRFEQENVTRDLLHISHISEKTSELTSDDESYQRKVSGKKKRERQMLIAGSKRLMNDQEKLQQQEKEQSFMQTLKNQSMGITSYSRKSLKAEQT